MSSVRRSIEEDILEDINMNKKYRKPVIAGNWKMNMLHSGTKDFMDELKPLLPRPAAVKPYCAFPSPCCTAW